MATVKVKATSNHFGDKGLIKVGDEYETHETHAQELVNNGLVEAKGITAKPEKQGQHILVSDKPKEKAENTTGNVPTAKKPKK